MSNVWPTLGEEMTYKYRVVVNGNNEYSVEKGVEYTQGMWWWKKTVLKWHPCAFWDHKNWSKYQQRTLLESKKEACERIAELQMNDLKAERRHQWRETSPCSSTLTSKD
jgi:hypothetical protein